MTGSTQLLYFWGSYRVTSPKQNTDGTTYTSTILLEETRSPLFIRIIGKHVPVADGTVLMLLFASLDSTDNGVLTLKANASAVTLQAPATCDTVITGKTGCSVVGRVDRHLWKQLGNSAGVTNPLILCAWHIAVSETTMVEATFVSSPNTASDDLNRFPPGTAVQVMGRPIRVTSQGCGIFVEVVHSLPSNRHIKPRKGTTTKHGIPPPPEPAVLPVLDSTTRTVETKKRYYDSDSPSPPWMKKPAITTRANTPPAGSVPATDEGTATPFAKSKNTNSLPNTSMSADKVEHSALAAPDAVGVSESPRRNTGRTQVASVAEASKSPEGSSSTTRDTVKLPSTNDSPATTGILDPTAKEIQDAWTTWMKQHGFPDSTASRVKMVLLKDEEIEEGEDKRSKAFGKAKAVDGKATGFIESDEYDHANIWNTP
ncbi:hypothetical protein FRB99_001561 [Tulasnella sp. 403]|nr:hypothetical protein FRB99_001561 [Tulasnella sp. 403]